MAEQQLTEEQRKELEEKIRKMSPEELAEFQRQQCVFCQIIAGKIPSQKVYENEEMMAILDINPASKGHLLLMPREHYAIMPQIPDQMVGRLMVMAKKLSQALLKGLKVEGTNVFVANGLAAGQRSQHFIIHIIPRREGDGIMALQDKFISKEMQQKVVMSIVNILNNLMGVKKEVIGVEEKKDQGQNNNKSEDNQSGKDIDDTFPKTAIRKDNSENIENIKNVKEESEDLGTYQQAKHIKLKKGSEKKNQKEHVHSILPVEAVQGTKTKRVRRGTSGCDNNPQQRTLLVLTGRQRSSMDEVRASKMLCTYPKEQKQEKQKKSAEEKQQKAKKRKTEGKGSNPKESKDEDISLDQIAEMFR